ncbi:PKD domain-containing protein [Candidatus Kaiserbacteria bacterium]|nr:PKD domain-containing protein [Candidatus Kaiserbacteria bacterium]
MTSVTALLLQAAISLLLFVQAHPSLDASLREQAIEVANHAITVATHQSETPQKTSQESQDTADNNAFSASPKSGNAPLHVNFKAQNLYDPHTFGYALDFGDGSDIVALNTTCNDCTNATGVAGHDYTHSGTYTATLSRWKDGGPKDLQTVGTLTISVGDANTAKTPVITSVNGKGGFGTGDSNSIFGKNFSTVTYVYLKGRHEIDYGKDGSGKGGIHLGYTIVDDTRLNVDVPYLVKDTYYLYVENQSGTSAPYFVGTIGAHDTLQSLTASCSAATFNFGTPGASWSAYVSGGQSPYRYAWTMFDDISNYGEGSIQSQALMVNYASIGTKKATVRITDASGTTISTSCSATISDVSTETQSGRSIAVLSPNGGETLTQGETYTIKWKSSQIDKVYLGWSLGTGSVSWIATDIPTSKNSGTYSYDWSVDIGTFSESKNVKISVVGYDTGTGSVTDESDAFFVVTND